MRWTSALTLAVVVAAAGCSSPPPPGAPLEVSAIAGRWRADGIQLDITEEGVITYERSIGGDFKLNGVSVTNVSTTGFDAGAFGLTTHFVIDTPPTTTGSVTTMSVDGRVLKKLGPDEGDTTALVPAPAPQTLPAPGTLASLVGRWEGSGDGATVTLHIQPDGTLDYRREHGGSHTALKGVTVQDITPASFAAGAFGVTTTFRVDSAPTIVDGTVRMTVDGVVLTKMIPAA